MKWIVGIAIIAIIYPGAKYLYDLMRYYPKAIKQSIEINPCVYFANLEKGIDINKIGKQFSLPVPHDTIIDNSLYRDRVFEYVVPHGVIRVGCTGTDNATLLFNGDYEIKLDTDSCSKWTARPTPFDSIKLKKIERK